MIKTQSLNIRKVPVTVAHRLRVLATVMQTRQSAVLGIALAKLEGKVGCLGCGVWIDDPQQGIPPPLPNSPSWVDLAKGHAEGCRWILTRGHQLEKPEPITS